MVSPSNPPHPLSDDTCRDLVNQTARLARAIETYNTRNKERSDPPMIQYMGKSIPDTIDPPRMPRHLSWHEKVREKKISIPVATGWSLVGLALTELLRLFLTGQLR